MQYALILVFIYLNSYAQPLCLDGQKNCMLEKSVTTNKETKKNILGQTLKKCSTDPLTGYYRDGTCLSDTQDYGNHSVCAVMTDEFLKYTLKLGNNLISANPKYNFPGLKAGDKWCLCASRWLEAYKRGVKVEVDIQATHMRALEAININKLQGFK